DDFMRRMITARLRVSARAFSDIGEIFELVSEKSNRFPGSSAKPSSKAGACASCPKRAICGALPSYQKAIKQARALDFESKDFSEKLLPDFFLENCQKPDALAVSLLREHMGSAAEKTVKKRAADMQTAISGQFIAISRLFDDMTGELVNFGVYKPAEAEKIEKELQADGITPQNVICRRMRGEKLAVEADGYSRFDEKKTKKIIDSAVKNVMGSGLSAPLFSYDKGRFLYRGGQRERFEISCGVAQHSKNNSRFCGDSYNFFYDGKGGAVFILSDGMGTGGSAAVDSAAVCGLFSRMVIAGAGFKSALLMVNSTLLARPDEESAATVDACFVNLYTGKANFIKAGAPYTYIKYEDGNEFLNMESLPVGILEGVSYAQKELDLSGGATIIMMSDGAAENLSEFSGNAADKYELLSAQDMAERLLQKCLLAQGGQEDDLTVAVLKLKRSAEEDTKSDKKTA
ncbi:MAG: SpoIIE family protein phosphatase, partial [Clostridia bacterium]|nr:SpoIIE family protein phosphatase [Clostridia bacterium]